MLNVFVTSNQTTGLGARGKMCTISPALPATRARDNFQRGRSFHYTTAGFYVKRTISRYWKEDLVLVSENNQSHIIFSHTTDRRMIARYSMKKNQCL